MLTPAGPVVSFNQTAVTVRESQTESTNATFTLDRKGYDLNISTLVSETACTLTLCTLTSMLFDLLVLISQVKYIYVHREGDTARENIDFRLYITDACSLVGESNGGCVSFSPGQTKAELMVQILPDVELEGNEMFHLKIEYVRNGMRTRDHQFFSMSVTIIDGEQRKILHIPHHHPISDALSLPILAATYIEFVNVTTVLFESSGPNELALRRRGYIDGNVTVNCILKGITASGGYTLQDDFFIPLTPQSVTFLPRETEKCEDWFMKFNPQPLPIPSLTHHLPLHPLPPSLPTQPALSTFVMTLSTKAWRASWPNQS